MLEKTLQILSTAVRLIDDEDGDEAEQRFNSAMRGLLLIVTGGLREWAYANLPRSWADRAAPVRAPMQRFRSPKTLQKFRSVHAQVHNLLASHVLARQAAEFAKLNTTAVTAVGRVVAHRAVRYPMSRVGSTALSRP